VAALSSLVAKVSLIAHSLPEIGEIELNPVIVHPEGESVTIVDALVVRHQAPLHRQAKAALCTH
jgi:acetate---CoA ligase (ADP-forming)